MTGQGLDTQVGLGDHVDVTDAAVYDYAFPAILRRLLGQHVAQQGATQGAAAVHHQDLALPGQVDLLLDQGVVLEALDGDYFAAKGIAPAEVAEHGLDDLHQVRVGIAQIRGNVLHGHLLDSGYRSRPMRSPS
ncbi:hypothetical protein D3C84_807750 [compost metagenome]